MSGAPASVLFPDGVRAVNVGLEMFAEPIAANGGSVARLVEAGVLLAPSNAQAAVLAARIVAPAAVAAGADR